MEFGGSMKKVLLRAPVLSKSGYGVHARQIARWLLSRPDLNVEFQILPWGDTSWEINPDSHDGLIREMMTHSTDPTKNNTKYDISFQLQLPNEWDSTIANYNVGMSAMVETDKCNPGWCIAANKMNMIIVPSKHAASCLTNSGDVTVPVHIVPEAYSDAFSKNDQNLLLPSLQTPFNFLIFGQLTGNNPDNDRKNIFYTIKWLCEAFKNDPDVGIVVKTNLGKSTKIDKRIVTQLITNVAIESRQKNINPKIHLLHGDMSDEEVSSLYTHPQIKCLVSLTRGEGFGLPLLEAATCGLPVIVPSWSGHTDFLKHGKFIDIFYQLDNVHQTRIDNAIFMSGAKWANANEDDFKKKVLKFKNNPTIPKQWALDLKTKLLSLYSFESISKQYSDLMKDVL